MCEIYSSIRPKDNALELQCVCVCVCVYVSPERRRSDPRAPVSHNITEGYSNSSSELIVDLKGSNPFSQVKNNN